LNEECENSERDMPQAMHDSILFTIITFFIIGIFNQCGLAIFLIYTFEDFTPLKNSNETFQIFDGINRVL